MTLERKQRQLPLRLHSRVVVFEVFIFSSTEMDVVLYVLAAVILLVLIVFAVRVRGRTEEGEGNIDIHPAAVEQC